MVPESEGTVWGQWPYLEEKGKIEGRKDEIEFKTRSG